MDLGRENMVLMMDYSMEPHRDILCVDVRSFFASVEAATHGLHPLKAEIVVMSNPHLDGGLVLAASPIVKEKYGIQTGSRKFELPKKSSIQIVEPRMALYLEYNLRIQKIFQSFVAKEDLHPYSIDECFLDISKSHSLFGSAQEIAYKLQEKIWDQLQLVTTIGIGDNPLLAKLALDNEAKHSPENSYIAEWRYKDVQDKVWTISPLTNMWGLGHRMCKNLNQMGIYSVYQLSQIDPKKLKKRYGVIGEQFFFHAHGIDQSVLSEKYIPKSNSYSKNQILEHDYKKQEDIEIVIREMAEENAVRLRENQVTTSLLHLSIRFSKRTYSKGFSHQMTIQPTNSTKRLIDAFIQLFRLYYKGESVRVITVSCGKIHHGMYQSLDLFESTEDFLKQEELEKTIDGLRKKYGYTSVLKASSLLSGSTVLKRAKLLGGHKA